jgi:hypothetical protein
MIIPNGELGAQSNASNWFTNLSGFPPRMVSSRFCLFVNMKEKPPERTG